MDVVDTLKKDIRDMDVMDLIEEIIETTKIAALNLWGTNRERTNIANRRMRSKNERYPTKSRRR